MSVCLRPCIHVARPHVCSRARIHVCARSHVVCRSVFFFLLGPICLLLLVCFVFVVVRAVPTLLPPFISSPALCVCLVVSSSHFTRQESPRQLLSICSPPPVFFLPPHTHNSAFFLFSLSSTKSVFIIRLLLSITETVLYFCFVYRGGGVVAQF